MQRISLWAHNHKIFSWFIIAIAHLLLISSAIFLANFAFFSGLSLNLYWLFALIGTLVLTILLYPTKNSSHYNYKNRKRGDLALVTTGFLLVFSLFNVMISEYEAKLSTPTNPNAIKAVLKSVTFDIENETLLTKFRKRIKYKSYRITRKFKAAFISTNEDISTDMQMPRAFLIGVSTIVLSIFLILLVTVLSYSTTCAGIGGLLITIPIIGYSGLLLSALVGIRAILGALTTNELT